MFPFRRKRDKSADLYNEIGTAAAEQIGTVDTKILIYAEYEDGCIDWMARFAANEAEVVDSLRDTGSLSSAIFRLISFLESKGQKHVWKSMEYVADYGQVDVKLSYDAVIGEGLDFWEKSPKILEKHFSGRPHR